MKNEPQKSSGVPLIIIGVVLAVAVLGAYFYYNSSKAGTGTAANKANSNAANRANAAATAPLGANPPSMLGSPTASVTVEEFADFQCPACASVHPVMKEIQSVYGNRIRFIFRNFPLAIPQHDKAYEAAVAAEAAGMQDRAKFWAMQNMLYENQKTWTANPNYRSLWEGYAQQVGLDVERFKNDMAGRDAKARVDADIARGRGLGFDSTPTLLINGKNVPIDSMTTANLRSVIDTEIQNAAKQPGSNAAAAPASGQAANTNTAK